MDITGIVIPVDHYEPLQVVIIKESSLALYQKLVDGLIEFLDLPHGASLLCNEEAKIRHMPFNFRATALFYLMQPHMIDYDYIAGPAVLLGQPDANGDTTSVPEIFVRLLAVP